MNVIQVLTAVASSEHKYFFPRLDIIGRMHIAWPRWSSLDCRLIPPKCFSTPTDVENVHITGSKWSLAEPAPQNDDAARNVVSSLFVVFVIVVVLVRCEGCGMPIATGWRISRHRICVCRRVVVIIIPTTVVTTTTYSWIKPVVVVVAVVPIIRIIIKGNRMLLDKCLLPVLNLLRLIDLFWGAVVVAVIVTGTAILVVPTTVVIFTVLVSGVIRCGFVAVVHFKISLSASTVVVVVASTNTSTSLMIDTSSRRIAAIADDVVVPAAAVVVEVVVLHSLWTNPPVFFDIVQEKKIVVSAPIVPTETV